jgi:hypothetical protein
MIVVNTQAILAIIVVVLLTMVAVDQSYEPAVVDQSFQQQAADECLARRGVVPPTPFSSDGCSLWPEGNRTSCCVEHDVIYWCGGNNVDRADADEKFRQCLTQKTSAFTARMMKTGVYLGGAEFLPFPWRWGYGWPYLSQ